jgi:hypothetical protein
MPGRPPSSNSFLSSGRGGALDTLEGEAMILLRPLWKGGADVTYNVYLRNNKLQFQWTDTPIIR